MNQLAGRIRDEISKRGVYVRVPAGKPFYLFVEQTIDPRAAAVGLRLPAGKGPIALKDNPRSIAAGLALLGACAAPSRPQAAPGAAHVGAPSPPFDQAVLDARPPRPTATAPGRWPIRMPDRITLPATYRLMLVDGHLALVRETDAQALRGRARRRCGS